MNSIKRNKQLILDYINALSGHEKTTERLLKYNADRGLIGYIQFIDSVFPAYEVFVEEMMAEGDKVIVRARFRGRHEGTIMGFEATHKVIEYPFVVRYQIKDDKIINSWVVADNLVLAEAVGMKSIRPKSKNPEINEPKNTR